jgi:hypothetical protein
LYSATRIRPSNAQPPLRIWVLHLFVGIVEPHRQIAHIDQSFSHTQRALSRFERATSSVFALPALSRRAKDNWNEERS